MLHFTRFKSTLILLVCLASILFALPNLFTKEQLASWPSFIPKHQMLLGLDLQGGAHLLLAMETEDLRKEWLRTLRDDARRNLRDAKLFPTGVGVVGNAVQVRLAKPEEADAAVRELRKLVQSHGSAVLGNASEDIAITKGEGGLITLTPTPAGLQLRVSQAAGAAIETVNRRINALGTSELTVVRQGSDRILVQYPGLTDTKALKDLIGQTAKLSFHEVHPTMTAEEARQGRVPSGYRIYPGSPRGDEPSSSYLLRETPVVPGDDLVDSQPGFDQRTNEPIITFRFNQAGARRFGRFTQENVNRPFAIVLDDKVLSAPVIREPILGGTGQISGSFTVETANTLAVQLRSGALPVALTIVEERTVGPSLGADSIAAGKLASLVGCLATIDAHDMGVRHLRPVCGPGPARERHYDHRADVDHRRRDDVAGHRGPCADTGHGGGCERADLRAHSRGTAVRQNRDLCDRCWIQPRDDDHSRQPAHDAGGRDHHVLARLGSDSRLRSDAVDRHLHVNFRGHHR